MTGKYFFQKECRENCSQKNIREIFLQIKFLAKRCYEKVQEKNSREKFYLEFFHKKTIAVKYIFRYIALVIILQKILRMFYFNNVVPF